jgi:thiol-disulfide isomerase/thioredoxin
MNNYKKHIPLVIVVILIVVSIGYLESKKPPRATGNANDSVINLAETDATSTAATTSIAASGTAPVLRPVVTASQIAAIRAQKSLKYPLAHDISTPDGFINTPTTTIKAQLQDNKVVLLDFWTYSCINCQRTLPYLNAWYQKYKDYGLQIIGVQTPEFEFEKNYDNVQKAVTQYGIKYPVVLDNDSSTWNAYGNQYWPEHYLIDIDGFVTDTHIGEGGYADTEKKIQALLRERAQRLGLPDNIPTSIVTNTTTIDTNSPETYFGWARNQYLGNGAVQQPGDQTLTLPSSPAVNTLYLGGSWNFQSEYAVTNGPAKIVYKYMAKNIFFVSHSAQPMTVQIIKDGQPAGSVTIQGAGLYTISQDSTAGTHTIELDIPSAGLEAYTFTFG